MNTVFNINIIIDQKRTNSKSPDTTHGGYATNFGAGLGSAGGQSVEGQVVECMFKILVTRLVHEIKDLKIQEDIVSISIYCFI